MVKVWPEKDGMLITFDEKKRQFQKYVDVVDYALLDASGNPLMRDLLC